MTLSKRCQRISCVNLGKILYLMWKYMRTIRRIIDYNRMLAELVMESIIVCHIYTCQLAECLTPVFPAVGRLKQENYEFESSLASICL